MALKALQRFILDHLGDPHTVLVIDETAELKKGGMTVGWPASTDTAATRPGSGPPPRHEP